MTAEPGDEPGGPGDDAPVSRGDLRRLIRAEIRDLIPGGAGDDDGDDGGGGDGGDGGDGNDGLGGDDAGLSLRQITGRALALTSAALEKIPGGPDRPAPPARPAPQRPPVPRGMRLLGFADPD